MQKLSTFARASALLALPLHAQSYEDLAGGWFVVTWDSPDREMRGPGLFLFTAQGQYSMMYVNTPDGTRAEVPEEPTDADIVEAFQSFTANSGRYRIDGSQLTYQAFVAKSPGYMAQWDPETGGNAVTVTMSMDEETLKLTWETGRSVTLRRPPGVDGGD